MNAQERTPIEMLSETLDKLDEWLHFSDEIPDKIAKEMLLLEDAILKVMRGASSLPQATPQERVFVVKNSGFTQFVALSKEDAEMYVDGELSDSPEAEITEMTLAAPKGATLPDVPQATPQPESIFCFECDDKNRCASNETCSAMHQGYPRRTYAPKG